MGIILRDNGYYYMQVRDGKKYKKVSLETKNHRLAQEIYNAYLLNKINHKLKSNLDKDVIQEIPKQNKEIIQSQRSPEQEIKTPIKPIYLEYVESCKIQGFTEPTIFYKNVLLKDMIRFKILNLEDVKQEKISPMLLYWQKSSLNSMRKHIANLKAFLNHCIKACGFSSSQYHGLRFPTLTVKVNETTVNENDFKTILENCEDTDFKLYLKTLWETGCRPNEITKLKKSEIDFNKGIGKIFQNKTQKYKIAYFTNELLAEIKECKDGYLFKGNKKHNAYYGIKFKKLRDKLGMDKGYSLYAIRHSFGTRMLNKTKDIHLVSKLLGHADISITAKHYINRNPEEIRAKLLEANENI